MIEPGGLNLGSLVSNSLDWLHPMLDVNFWRYTGYTNSYGELTPQYSGPFTVRVQVQNIDNAMLRKMGMANDNTQKIWVWFTEDGQEQPEQVNVLPLVVGNPQEGGRGGDMIEYDERMYYVVAGPDDFRQTGWVSAIGVLTRDARPT